MHYFGRAVLSKTLHKYLQQTILKSKLPRFGCCACLLHTSNIKTVEEKENMDELEKNPYFAKYADKIKKLQQEEPALFSSRVDSMKEEKGRQLETKRKDAEAEKARLTGNQMATSGSTNVPKELSDIMKLDMIKDKSAKEVTEIWHKFHSTKDGVYGVIQAAEYEVMQHRALKYPTFIFPIPRADGYEFIMAQFSGHQCHFTPLIEYQKHKENAPTCMTMNHYTDLQLDKGIVLMAGDRDPDKLKKDDALLLAHQVQMYYGSPSNEQRRELVRKFNEQPETFVHTDLLEEFQKMTTQTNS